MRRTIPLDWGSGVACRSPDRNSLLVPKDGQQNHDPNNCPPSVICDHGPYLSRGQLNAVFPSDGHFGNRPGSALRSAILWGLRRFQCLVGNHEFLGEYASVVCLQGADL